MGGNVSRSIIRSPSPPLALEQPIFVGFGQIVDGDGDAYDADRLAGVNSRVTPPLPSPFPRVLIVDKEMGDCSHAPLHLPRLSVSRRYHPTPALANCCFVRGYLPMCVLLLSSI